MAASSGGHLSHETGHTAGFPRILLVAGLVVMLVGLALLLWGTIEGFFGTSDFGDTDALPLLAIGAPLIVVGLSVAALAAALARHSAGE